MGVKIDYETYLLHLRKVRKNKFISYLSSLVRMRSLTRTVTILNPPFEAVLSDHVFHCLLKLSKQNCKTFCKNITEIEKMLIKQNTVLLLVLKLNNKRVLQFRNFVTRLWWFTLSISKKTTITTSGSRVLSTTIILKLQTFKLSSNYCQF